MDIYIVILILFIITIRSNSGIKGIPFEQRNVVHVFTNKIIFRKGNSPGATKVGYACGKLHE